VARNILTDLLLERNRSRKLDFRFTEFSEDEKADPPDTQYPLGLQTLYTGSNAQEGGSAHMDGSKDQPNMTAGLDLGDKYSYLCLIDTQSGEVMEEGRLRTTPEALRRRFASEQPTMRIAIETGTHSPWVSRVLEECGHEVLVANARKLRLIYARANARPTRSMP
jgi:hypothetical protein